MFLFYVHIHHIIKTEKENAVLLWVSSKGHAVYAKMLCWGFVLSWFAVCCLDIACKENRKSWAAIKGHDFEELEHLQGELGTLDMGIQWERPFVFLQIPVNVFDVSQMGKTLEPWISNLHQLCIKLCHKINMDSPFKDDEQQVAFKHSAGTEQH